MKRVPTGILIVALSLSLSVPTALLSGCDDEAVTTTLSAPQTTEMSTAFTNEYFAATPSLIYLYERHDENGSTRVTLTPTTQTRVVRGVECAVFTGYAYLDDPVNRSHTDTIAWYAEDQLGNVWCFGRQVTEYEKGEVVGTAGSWEAGVDGAVPCIVMKGEPRVGDIYHQGYADGRAEIIAEVLDVDATVEIEYGSFQRVVKIKESTSSEPGMSKVKYYAPELGLVLVEQEETGSIIEQLVDLFSP
ncbi:MAG: hypothetical protein JW990_10965 [Thermoleophilia bacterium]|nr:hypothetical protein [Thermoleophilia bacterium]